MGRPINEAFPTAQQEVAESGRRVGARDLGKRSTHSYSQRYSGLCSALPTASNVYPSALSMADRISCQWNIYQPPRDNPARKTVAPRLLSARRFNFRISVCLATISVGWGSSSRTAQSISRNGSILERFPLYAPRGLCCCKSELVWSQYSFVADSRLAKSLFYGVNLTSVHYTHEDGAW